MASIEERTANDGSKSYRVKVRVKGYPMETATFSRKTDAKDWARDTEADIKRGKYFKTSEAKKHTVKNLVSRYKRDVLPAKKSAADQGRHLDWWVEQIGAYSLAEVTSALIIEYRDKLKAGDFRNGKPLGPATVNRYLSSISHPFSVARKEWGWIEENPVLKISKLKEPRGRVRFLSDDERGRLLKACKNIGEPLYTLVVIALSTGARKSEVTNLTWADVDLGRGLIILNETKNDERRAIPLQSHALELVEKMDKVRRIDTNLLFPGRHDPAKPIYIHKTWQAALKQAEIENFRFHDLRHSCASYLAMNGASIPEIASVLGHKTLQMVKRYAHLSDQHTLNVVARMNKQIFG